VAYFPAPRSAQKLNFSNGKRRKVIVKQKAFLGFARSEGFQTLFVISSA